MTNMSDGIFWEQLSEFARVIIHFRISNKTENKRFHDKNKTDNIPFSQLLLKVSILSVLGTKSQVNIVVSAYY